MIYQEAISFLFSSLPMYQRIGQAAYKANLDNSLKLDAYFNHPHRKFRSIHVAGTNGKGSVSHMISAVLQAAGYKTGLYTSPHLKDFRERIRINGEMISKEEVTSFVEKHRSIIDELQPSFFEMTVAMAFDYFARSKVDLAVIEVGMGGRLDSTNIITPILSVITNIGYDHTQFLGDTLPEIAREKAGIIKKEVPVVIGETQKETQMVFIDKATECNTTIEFADTHYNAVRISRTSKLTEYCVNNKDTFHLDLGGDYQSKNLQTVLCALHTLKGKSILFSENDVKHALAKVQASTGLKGRWQVISEQPFIVCDTGHNAEGLKYTMQQVAEQNFERLHIVFGVVSDKKTEGIFGLLPHNAIYYFTKAGIPRSMNEHLLKELAGNAGLNGESYPDVATAYNTACQNAGINDMIYIGGSTFVVAELDLF